MKKILKVVRNKFWNLYGLIFYDEPELYCCRCGACGYRDCCSPDRCDHGFGCKKLYDNKPEEEFGPLVLIKKR